MDTINSKTFSGSFIKTLDSYPYGGPFYYLKNDFLPPEKCQLCLGDRQEDGESLEKYKGRYLCNECLGSVSESEAIEQFEQALDRERRLLN